MSQGDNEKMVFSESATLLLERGASVNAQGNGGRTALSLARDFGRANTVETLRGVGQLSSSETYRLSLAGAIVGTVRRPP